MIAFAAELGQLQLPGLGTGAREYGPCPHCAGMGQLTATDIFCGAGGSSLGLEFVCCPHCGRSLIQVTQAINHWDLAVQAHNANFPLADHDVHGVEEIPVTRFRRTDLLWASPECTHHAYCRGPKELTEDAFRSRATFADIVRFTKHHRYDAVIVENVVEARLWCDEPGHKEKCSCGRTFNAWFRAMTDLGYDGQVVYFNSQFALPTPQSRDRMYVVFWRNGVRRPNLDFRPVSWCSSCETVVHGVQTFKAASKGSLRTLDGLYEWGRYGQQYLYRCPACTSPVAPAVTGARSMIDWALPAVCIGDRSKPLAVNTRKRIKVGLEYIGRLAPVAVQVGGNLYERPGYARVWSVENPLRTVVGTAYMGLVSPAGGQAAAARCLDEPSHTIVGSDRLALTLRVGGQNTAPRELGEPGSTITAHDRQRALVVAGKSDTVPASVGAPAPTVTGRPHLGFVRPLEDAAGTVTGRDKQSLLVPYNRTGVARTVDEPSGTLTTRDREALVVTDADIDACLFRMLQWPELLRAQVMHMLPDGNPYLLTARRRNARGKFVELSNELRVKMIGNAVSSPVSTMLGWAVAEALA